MVAHEAEEVVWVPSVLFIDISPCPTIALETRSKRPQSQGI